MKLLANAHISRAICGFLDSAGHDCVHAELLSPGLPDEEVLRRALTEERVILTADKDFGELVFRRLLPVCGVILLRFRVPSEAERLALFQRHWPVIERNVPGHFVVATSRAVRRSPLPRPGGQGPEPEPHRA
jgi:predicted nuclease of predicted toxin-antitoxin system